MKSCRELLGAWVIAVLPVVLAGASLPTQAASTASHADLLKKADAAFAAGDSELATTLYRAVLAAQPDQSRALFRLGKLAPRGSAEAIRLLRRYTEREPSDPWGHMALGDALAQAMRSGEALDSYGLANRLAPREDDVTVGRQRVLLQSGRLDELISEQEASVAQVPDNPDAWRSLGRLRQRAGRHEEAADAYARALVLRNDAATKDQLRTAQAESAPSLRPYVRSMRDSDANRVRWTGADALLPAFGRLRLGVNGERASVRDANLEGKVDTAKLIGHWRPLHALRIDANAGITRIEQPAGTTDERGTTGLRLRWRNAIDGPAGELQWLRQPLIGTTALLASPVELSEARLAAELPLAGPLFVRLRTHAGRLDDAQQQNRRSNHRVSLGYRLSPVWEVQAAAGRLSYDAPAANYFAPERVLSAEVGTYLEIYRFWPLTLGLDAGLGRQRVTRFGQATDASEDSLRINATATWDIRPGTQLALEFDHESSAASSTATATGADWRSNSVMLSLRFAIAAPSSAASTAR